MALWGFSRGFRSRRAGVGVGVEASAPRAFWSVTLVRGSLIKTLRSRNGLSRMFCLVASSLGHLRSQCSVACGSSLRRGHSGSAEQSRRSVLVFKRGV